MAANKVGEWEFSEEEILRDIEEATKRGEESLRNEPQAESVKFDEGNNLIMLYLTNGCVFGFPPDLIKELRTAKPAEIAQAELTSLGTGVFWENLDADYTVSGLLHGVFGTKVWMKELGRKGGSVKSAAKREAAKINGAKGGRPRKDIGVHHFQVSLPKTDYLSSLNSTKNYLPFKASVTTLNVVPVGKLEETKEYIEEPINHKNKHIIKAKILSFRTKTETNLPIKNIKVSKLEEEYAGESIAA